MLHLYFCFKVYCCGSEKDCVCVFHPSTNPLSYPDYLIDVIWNKNWSTFFLMICLYYVATPVSSSMIALAILVRFPCCVSSWTFIVIFSWGQLAIKCGVSFTWLCIFHGHFWCHILYYGINPCIGYYYNLGGVYSYYSYATIGVSFAFWLSVGTEVLRFIGSFSLRDELVLGGFICLNSTLVCSVSLWGVSCVVLFRMLFPTLGNKNRSSRSYVVCLKLSSKLRIDCNLLAPMDANGAVSDGF